MNPLDPIDLVALALVVVNVLIGFARGFVWQLVRLAALVAGLLIARAFAPRVSALFTSLFPELDERIAAALAWVSVIGAVFIVGSWLAFALRRVLVALRLKSFDRALGAVLGLVKGVAWVVLAVLIASQLDLAPETHERLAGTASARVAHEVVDRASEMFPDSIRERFDEWMSGRGGAADRR